ncbi:HlyD family secretion protein [Mangrovicoccus sp. HB161399]|uniref:HlyD family secretion protein n=1 Tax=Mangrovicoccus sp. HB161399 TaxID=2720392 RepID=UPI001551F283|nr:HlyD family secretion protein [Mangrovicoccus sp. HB161399]
MAFDTSDDGSGQSQDRAAEPVRNGAAEEPKPRRRPVRKIVLGLVLLAALGFGGREGYGWWTDGRFMETTDDAYLQADISEISPEVTGTVTEVAITDNQPVKAGQVLFRIDQGDYRIALDKAKAEVATQQQTMARIRAQIEAAKASVTQAEATQRSAAAALKNAQSTADRVKNLNSSSFASKASLDDAVAALEEAQAQQANADASVRSAEANVSVLEAQLAEAQAQSRSLELAVDQAQRNLDRTVLRAPYDGVVANIAAENGELVSPGTLLAAVVPSGALYVEANFKETQLGEVRAGAVAHLTFDMLPGVEVEGRVESLAPATGALFSLLPAENATGNFTKVVQRVPVRIALPADTLADGRLRAGLSTIVSVDTRTGGTSGS